ncbi:response regulator transcription factor [Streptomyces sp. NBC_01465]|uniref:response regulator transcription factor n=1 Tax=Streptomyces sp. NBC_01465 TaxID=2903878 RepID=UPI002E321941|nr:response regulator transcription factor [Streptomyces sp. NBC_01465]
MRPSPSGAAGLPAAVRPRIVLIEDDADLAAMCRAFLERDAFQVTWAHDARTGHAAVLGHPTDLLVLDLGLPDGSGLDLLRALRRTSGIPVIIVTGWGEEADRVVGLELGADDYLVKPFSQRELAARIRAVLRRSGPEGVSDVIELGLLRIDTAACQASTGDVALALRPKEYALLEVLARAPGRVFSADQLLKVVWDSTPWLATSTVTEHVYRLRRHLTTGLSGRPGPAIITVRGFGYRLDA